MFTYIKVLTLLIAAFLVRPTAFGQNMTSLAIILGMFVLFLYLIETLKTRKSEITKKNFIVLLSSSILWFYFLVHAWISGSNHMEFVIKAFIAHMIIILVGSIVLSNEKNNLLFFKGFIFVLLISSVSFCVTFILSFITGLDALYLFTLPIEGYEFSGNVYFPLTILYGLYTSGDVQLPRLLGLFRESGILQAFLIWAYFNLESYNLNKKWIKLFLIFGVIGTFSTAGIGIFLATLSLKYLLNRKPTRSFLILAFMVIALVFAPFIGLQSKSETHGTSISDRTYATTRGLEKLMENPIGEGLYNMSASDLPNAGINLLAASYKIGIVGIILVLFVYFSPVYKYAGWKNYLVCIFPFFLTMLFSQPILDAPLVYLMFLAMYRTSDQQIGNERAKSKRRKIRIAA